MILEHELSTQSAQAFIDAYPLMQSTGWKITSATQIEGESVYLNSKDSISPVQEVSGVLGYLYTNIPSSSSSIPSSTSPTPVPTNTSDANSNTSKSDKSESTRTVASKFTSVLGAILLTVAFYNW